MEKEKIKKIKGNFIWYDKKWENVDLSELESISESAYLQGYTGELPLLESIGESAYLQGYNDNLPLLESIGGYADLQGYTGELPLLESISGYADLRGYTGELPKLKKVKEIYIEYRDESLSLKEWRKLKTNLNLAPDPNIGKEEKTMIPQYQENMTNREAFPPRLTAGENAVGLNFNPSGDEKVAKIKSLFAQAFDIVEQSVPADDGTIPTARKRKMRDSALHEIISAQMWAVKVITLK